MTNINKYVMILLSKNERNETKMAKNNRRAKENEKKNKPMTEKQKYDLAVQNMLEDANHNLLPKFKR